MNNPENYKYIIIVSKYYYSYHSFISVIKEDEYWDKITECANELIEYKRAGRECDYMGDLAETYNDGVIKRRYNINDQGDIYFINTKSVTGACNIVLKYNGEKMMNSRGYKKVEVKNNIRENHDYEKVKNIVEKYFEIA